MESVARLKKMNSEFDDIKFNISLGAGPYVAGEETAMF
jgi:NADH:ubiquinone oxidoreductase subunit F (NADH-binding)